MTELFIWIIATTSLTIWQIAFAIKFIGVKSRQTIQTVQNIPTTKSSKTLSKTQTPGVVDVNVRKSLKIGSADGSAIESDETIKGKVKTQKNKLKQLRKI